eukprot:14241930-Alexandrium_andersonii.AAC.1
MPHAADASPSADANRGAAVRAHLQARLDAEVPGYRRQPRAFSCSFDDARRFCFPRARSAARRARPARPPLRK